MWDLSCTAAHASHDDAVDQSKVKTLVRTLTHAISAGHFRRLHARRSFKVEMDA